LNRSSDGAQDAAILASIDALSLTLAAAAEEEVLNVVCTLVVIRGISISSESPSSLDDVPFGEELKSKKVEIDSANKYKGT
jgi:hypothetical protein